MIPMRSLPIAVAAASAALAIDPLLAEAHAPLWLLASVGLVGVALLPWMAVSILRDRSAEPRELDGEEWGYLDRPDLRPTDRALAAQPRPTSRRSSAALRDEAVHEPSGW